MLRSKKTATMGESSGDVSSTTKLEVAHNGDESDEEQFKGFKRLQFTARRKFPTSTFRPDLTANTISRRPESSNKEKSGDQSKQQQFKKNESLSCSISAASAATTSTSGTTTTSTTTTTTSFTNMDSEEWVLHTSCLDDSSEVLHECCCQPDSESLEGSQSCASVDRRDCLSKCQASSSESDGTPHSVIYNVVAHSLPPPPSTPPNLPDQPVIISDCAAATRVYPPPPEWSQEFCQRDTNEVGILLFKSTTATTTEIRKHTHTGYHHPSPLLKHKLFSL